MDSVAAGRIYGSRYALIGEGVRPYEENVDRLRKRYHKPLSCKRHYTQAGKQENAMSDRASRLSIPIQLAGIRRA